MPQRIRSIAALREYNSNPTSDKPIVMEWAYEEVFRLTDLGQWDMANELVAELCRFASVCEKMTEIEGRLRTLANLSYYSRYAARWEEHLDLLDIHRR